ncbi:hypothetical protein G3I13_20940 [Streptomyces sp. SID6673]|nr:hypothetical protein [Streptomyces sp. SID11726]NEB26806.1 hypothetical protein [Streptomyces sp. SID6673]
MRQLTGTLRELSDDAAGISAVDGAPLAEYGLNSTGTLQSVTAALNIATKTQATLVPSMTQRLDEIANLMDTTATEFANADDDSAEKIAAAITVRSGDWGAPA